MVFTVISTCYKTFPDAAMAELVDVLASGASERKLVEVQVLKPPNASGPATSEVLASFVVRSVRDHPVFNVLISVRWGV